MGQLNPSFSNSFNLQPQTPNNVDGGVIDPGNFSPGGFGGRDNGTPLNIPGASQGNPNPSGPSANPAAGAAGFNNFNAPPLPGTSSGTSSPPANGAGASGPQWFNGQNWNPTFQNNAGYNPSQYATQETANTLAGAMGSGLGLGANVNQTQNAPGSPIGPPPQQMLNFGGDAQLNAGLMAERYKKYDQATADAMTRAELAYMNKGSGGQNEDSQGGSLGFNSQFAASPGGNQNLGGGQNIGQFRGENQGSSFGSRPAFAGGFNPSSNPATGQYGNPQGNYSGGQYQNPGHGGAPPPFQGSFGPGNGYGQRPQFGGSNTNYGGFGGSQQFGQANQGAGVQQLLQRLMGGGQGGYGGQFQQRGRQGQMSGLLGQGQFDSLMGLPSFLQRGNQATGQGVRNPYQTGGNMSGLARSNNSLTGGRGEELARTGQMTNPANWDMRGQMPASMYSDNRDQVQYAGGSPGFYNQRSWSPTNPGGSSPSVNTPEEMNAQRANRDAQMSAYYAANPSAFASGSYAPGTQFRP